MKSIKKYLKINFRKKVYFFSKRLDKNKKLGKIISYMNHEKYKIKKFKKL